MAEFWSIYPAALAIILAGMAIVWVASVFLRNASIVDPFWGLAFVISAWFYFAQTPDGFAARRILVVTLVSIWGLRLCFFLLWRNWGKGEDYRYRAFRSRYGPERYWWVSFFQTFMLQGALAWLISSPLLGAQISGSRLNLLDYLGVAVWLTGLFFEAGSDFQLARFRADPSNQGKLLTTGFWKVYPPPKLLR